jgi:tripartite-type tricarboxylate transporter receptor subunit TctC
MHIAYNGSAPALTDVIAGRVPVMFDLWSSAKPYVADGGLRVLAVARNRLTPTETGSAATWHNGRRCRTAA